MGPGGHFVLVTLDQIGAGAEMSIGQGPDQSVSPIELIGIRFFSRNRQIVRGLVHIGVERH